MVFLDGVFSWMSVTNRDKRIVDDHRLVLVGCRQRILGAIS